jgi:hypothetical protein
VRAKHRATYNQLADELVSEFAAPVAPVVKVEVATGTPDGGGVPASPNVSLLTVHCALTARSAELRGEKYKKARIRRTQCLDGHGYH